MDGNIMQLRQVRHFLAALDCGSMTQAAVNQNVTQPTLSRSIRMLEKTLKVDLLERSHGGVIPTRYGEIFAEHARSIVSGVDHARWDLGAMRAGRLGHVRLGLGESALQPQIAGAIGCLALAAKDLTVSIDYDVQEVLLAKLRRGELDAIIDLKRSDLDIRDLKFRVVTRIALVIVVRKEHPLAGRRRVSKADLAAMPWAILDQPGAEAFYRQMLGPDDPLQDIRVRCVAPTILRMLACESDFLIMTTRLGAERDLFDGTLVEIDCEVPAIESDLCVITRRSAFMTGATRFTLEEIERQLATQARH